MKVFALIFLCWFSAVASASDAFLIAVDTPKPAYPRELLKKRHTGKVVVNLTISAFGTVQNSRIVESSHPVLAEATQQALVRWRYKPWEVATGRAGHVDITIPVIFGARGLAPFSKEITVGLENTLCAYLNQEVKISKADFPNDPLSKVDVFWHTQLYLTGSYVNARVKEPARRKTLLTELEKAAPKIVQHCKQNPDARYADYLPHEIRGVLVSHQ